MVRPSVLSQLLNRNKCLCCGDGGNRRAPTSQTHSLAKIFCWNIPLSLKNRVFQGRTIFFLELLGIEYAHCIDLDVLIPNHIGIDTFLHTSDKNLNL